MTTKACAAGTILALTRDLGSISRAWKSSSLYEEMAHMQSR
jgi:hypothetical protein